MDASSKRAALALGKFDTKALDILCIPRMSKASLSTIPFAQSGTLWSSNPFGFEQLHCIQKLQLTQCDKTFLYLHLSTCDQRRGDA